MARTNSSCGPAMLVAGCGVVLYTHLGYPLLMSGVAWLLRRPLARPADGAEFLPRVTVVISAFDEEAVIAAKIANTRELDYPPDDLEILVVADGSTDCTVEIARSSGATIVFDPVRRGKSAAVNRGVAHATGQIVLLTDANCFLDPGTVRSIVAEFVDARVAVVSGAKRVHGGGTRGAGEGLYWSMESWVKQSESAVGATMGSPGEVTGVRKSVFRPIPPRVINDDFHLACDALRQGWLVRYAPAAVATEEISLRLADDYERRTRTAAGTWQTTIEHLDLADPRRGWTALAFVSHRLLRSIVVPVLLPLLWCASIVLAGRSRLTRLLAGAQTGFYAAAILGARTDSRVLAVPFQFGLMNLAALRGARRYLSHSQPVAWRKAPRQPSEPAAREG